MVAKRQITAANAAPAQAADKVATPTKLIASAIGFANKVMQVFGPEFQAATKELAGNLFGLGQTCLKQAEGDYVLAKAFFDDACRAAENAIKQRDKADNARTTVLAVRDIMPSWNPAKSPISSALGKGIDISELPDHSAVRKAITAERAARTPTAPSVAALPDSPELKAALDAWTAALKGIKAEHAVSVAVYLTGQLGNLERVGQTGKVDAQSARAAAKEAAMRGGRALTA